MHSESLRTHETKFEDLECTASGIDTAGRIFFEIRYVTMNVEPSSQDGKLHDIMYSPECDCTCNALFYARCIRE